MADDIDNMIDVVDGTKTIEETEVEEYVAQYKVIGEGKIPVSKHTGAFWETRKKDAMKLMESSGELDRWEEAIEYYQNDQGSRGNRRSGLNQIASGSDNESSYMTENIVFSNVSALVPAQYAKNPDIEITAEKDENEAKAKMFERLVDTLFSRKVSPGLDIKPKMKKATVMALLTNISYLDLSYIKKEDSSEETFAEMQRLAEELESNKSNSKVLQELEGQLIALEGKVSILSSAGPRISVRHPKLVIVDPHAEDNSPNSANYMMVGELILTSVLNALYRKKNEDGEYESIYKPTHVVSGKGGDDDMDTTINNFSILGTDTDYSTYGFDSQAEFDASCRTLVWNVYDKSTRRILMFHDQEWSWPIWVWDDPYKLTRFFPLFPLSYYTDPISRNARSEVSYYLDQQDELNKIAQEKARMRHWVMTKVFFDSNAIKDVKKLDQLLSSTATNHYLGIELPEGKKISDVVASFPAPSTQFDALFDSRPILESISRMSSVTPTMQNVQFKTNTTNKAIESYESSTQLRLDEKIDAMEEVLADIAIALIEMCIQFMSEEEVIDLIGEEVVREAEGWPAGLTPQEFHKMFNLKTVGGSTLKPTSKVKKEQAMQMGQVLGQFASNSPAVVLVMLKMMERAFADDVTITDAEWKSMTSMMEKGMKQQEGGGGGGGQQEILAQLSQMLEKAPPEIKQQVGQAIAQGVPLQEVIAKFMEMAKQAQGQQQQQAPQQPQQPQGPPQQ